MHILGTLLLIGGLIMAIGSVRSTRSKRLELLHRLRAVDYVRYLEHCPDEQLTSDRRMTGSSSLSTQIIRKGFAAHVDDNVRRLAENAYKAHWPGVFGLLSLMLGILLLEWS